MNPYLTRTRIDRDDWTRLLASLARALSKVLAFSGWESPRSSTCALFPPQLRGEEEIDVGSANLITTHCWFQA